MTNIALLSGWKIDENNGCYYINYTHYIYLKQISKMYNRIVLFAPFRNVDALTSDRNIYLDLNIEIEPLPYFDKYSEGMKYFTKYFKAINKYKDIDLFYCRFPAPYAWMPKLVFRKRCIVDHVGDAIVENFANKNKNILIKLLKTIFFLPEYILILIASKLSKTTTRGEHIANKLNRFGIGAKSIVSSTILESELFHKNIEENKKSFVITYLGYLRYPKGVMILPGIINKLKNKGYNIKLNLIGDGEAKTDIVNKIKELKLTNDIILHGHIDNRERILNLLRESDFFIFPSAAGEGSPRVILEAMANSCLIISTPVGSLPYHFKDKESILFAKFYDQNSFVLQIEYAINNTNESNLIIRNAFIKIEEKYLMKDFIKKVFTYET